MLRVGCVQDCNFAALSTNLRKSKLKDKLHEDMHSFDQRSCKNTTQLRGKEYYSRSFLFHLDELQVHMPDVIPLCVYNAFILYYVN